MIIYRYFLPSDSDMLHTYATTYKTRNITAGLALFGLSLLLRNTGFETAGVITFCVSCAFAILGGFFLSAEQESD